jgi:hypothetical protein
MYLFSIHEVGISQPKNWFNILPVALEILYNVEM